MQECDDCATPLIDVPPTVIQYTGQKRQQFRINMSNVSTNPVVNLSYNLMSSYVRFNQRQSYMKFLTRSTKRERI
ncbi:hypothetical protein DPMN_088419 [Dreissena polymorpha]|uniref:Uncharacterized protein n=1 Tax=Dreissena polymorpha TaxID=45954 RepID=A0A9D4KV11_DREPO|nr:hypothetical protein DPMN_088419 [Dreissena polymorpha]